MINAKDACQQLGVDKETLFSLRDKFLLHDKTADTGNHWRGLPTAPWFTEDAIAFLKEQQEEQLTTAPVVQLRVIEHARNDKFVHAWDAERMKNVACLIPSRYKGKLKGKFIQAERIESASGASYRHIWFKERGL